MKRKPRRDKFKLYGDLLSAIYYYPTSEKIVLTQIQLKINVPFDRLKTYIAELAELGLIMDDTSLKLSKKGIEYLRMYKKILDFMKRMGLEYR